MCRASAWHEIPNRRETGNTNVVYTYIQQTLNLEISKYPVYEHIDAQTIYKRLSYTTTRKKNELKTISHRGI